MIIFVDVNKTMDPFSQALWIWMGPGYRKSCAAIHVLYLDRYPGFPSSGIDYRHLGLTLYVCLQSDLVSSRVHI